MTGMRIFLLALLLALPVWAGPELDQANALLKEGRFPEAVTAAQKAVAVEPGSAKAQLALARAAEGNGDLDLAGKSYGAAFQLASTDLEVSLAMADFLARAGDVETAVEVYTAAGRNAPTSLEPARRMARALDALYLMGLKGLAHERVIAAYQAVVSRPESNDADAYGLASCLLEVPASPEKAAEAIQKGQERWPDSALLRLAQARLALHRGQLKAARESFERALAQGLPESEANLAREMIQRLKEQKS